MQVSDQFGPSVWLQEAEKRVRKRPVNKALKCDCKLSRYKKRTYLDRIFEIKSLAEQPAGICIYETRTRPQKRRVDK